ncbi:hypothetical protein E2542_SST21400 [Spatholobus suberectus]|nr:hypothetical protein E2542_SST21400 [Spatholobus suberectus]
MKRIVIKVHVETDKCKSKALKIAALAQGVQSLSLEGESSDQLVVTGDVDAVCLTNRMRKKFRYATLVSVEDVEDSEEGGDEGGGEEQEDGTTPKDPCPICGSYLPPCPMHASYLAPSPMYPHVVYDSYPNSCSIL